MVDLSNRQIPLWYITDALWILKKIKEKHRFDIDIFEIGCMRVELEHDVDNERCQGCCDGHSTYLFARSGLKTVSVDNNKFHVAVARKSCTEFYDKNLVVICSDAISYVKENFRDGISIGLLYLDAWDVMEPDSAEKHLEFYNILKPFLKNNPIILIDDTDIWYDQEKKEYFEDYWCVTGKGKLLVPLLKREGYQLCLMGRQTLLIKPWLKS